MSLSRYSPGMRSNVLDPVIWDPFRDTSDIFHPLEVFNRGFGNLGLDRPLVSSELSAGPWRTGIRMDLVETGDSYEVHADLPGVKKDMIDVTVSDNTLTVSASKTEEHEEDTDTFHRRERFMGKTRRSIRLPVDADGNTADAKFENG
eukprot:gene45397-60649_t